MKKDDPFSGIKLSEQGGPDQRLFSREAKPATEVESNKPITRERGKEGSRERGREIGKEVEKHEASEAAQIGMEADTSQVPVYKMSFMATESEWNLFDDLKLDLRRRYGRRVTKNDIARLAIRLLAEDYEENREASFLVRKLPRK